MNEPPRRHSTSKPTSEQAPDVRIVEIASIPVFNCRVLVRHDGACRARVANLSVTDVVAASEREALQQIVARFKKVVSKYHESGEVIPWLDPSTIDVADDETERLIAVHL